MPGIVGGQRNDDDQQMISSNATSYHSLSSNDNGNGLVSCSSNGFWSKHRDDINHHQLQKFWSELSPQARQDLLRIDKPTLYEQARKNMYCSRCNGLLLEGFAQILMYGKSLQHEGGGGKLPSHKLGISKDRMQGGPIATAVCQDETQDPSVHPWGGLITTRDSALTLLDCYLYSKSLKGLQNVFDSARARERERELLYPDACGGGGRGWISQGIASYGRGHGTRETCALHTARLSCDTLVDFWSALGEETRQSLLRMKEEDFIERLVHRFDSKRFCRDCRKNVIREFKELKELKRMRKELRCTSWFCVADTAFQYEVSNDAIHADWHQMFIDSIGTYHHFEWAVGSGEGKSDILEYENVGMTRSVQVNGLDLAGMNACYITLRAWKLDGRCTEFSVKAHALKGRQCVHCRLVVGDGYVTITRGESIRKFFEHAEEAEEEEDDDSIDKDGNDFDGECSRPQKHAKSPELAREFLLDAATVIFKEQVEKAFREGTARQNAHSIFVCLALKLLEERIHVACKEIITLEKQMKLLEEEEREKRDEEERKERKRTKEREKKLRRKERLRVKDKKCSESSENPLRHDVSEEVLTSCIDEEANNCNKDSVSDTGETNVSESASPGVLDESSSNDNTAREYLTNGFDGADCEFTDVNDDSGLFMVDSFKGSRRKWSDRRRSTDNGAVPYKSEPRYYDNFSEVNCFTRQSRANAMKFSSRNGGPRFGQKVQCSSIRASDRNELHSCGCNQQNDFKAKVEPHAPTGRFSRENRSAAKIDSAPDVPKTVNRVTKFNQVDYMRDNCGRARSKISNYANALGRDSPYTKQVWEPVEPHKRYPRSNSDSDVTLRSCFKTEEMEPDKAKTEVCSDQISEELPQHSVGGSSSNKFSGESSSHKVFHTDALYQAKEAAEEENDLSLMGSCNLNRVSDFSPSSSSDNCSSCLSEGDTNTPLSSHPNLESSSISDSEDSSQQSEGRRSSDCLQNGLSNDHEAENEKVQIINNEEAVHSRYSAGPFTQNVGNHNSVNSSAKSCADNVENGKAAASVASAQQGVLPSVRNQNLSFPVFQGPSSLGYYHPSPVAWPAAPTNGLMTYPHPNHYLMPSPFGYSLNGDSPFCMQYGPPVQHLASPFVNNNQIPVYQPVPRTNSLNPQDQSSGFKVNGVKDPSGGTKRENVATAGHHPTEVPSNDTDKSNSTKLDSGNTGFSLFQFGGPVALPTYRSSEDEKGGCHIDEDQVCSKKETTIEEYNLFAARNGIQFSIF